MNIKLLKPYLKVNDIDREIQKLTIEGERDQEFRKTLKVAGIGLVAVTGLTLGAMGTANRAGDRQFIRDRL